ncbi:hypothetical protein PIB30_080047 [Stylosanthes scabra]|uniref:Uncharacterized protein n=1 Tax=Stylosanthes scabra TaxID=79078 RepID=A0ABU6RRB8_9FABA|nr:hypothetical protein [Stylosanthes scabra]
MEEEIPIVNKGAGENSNPQPTPEKEIDQINQTIQQLEAALRELLERETREGAIATEAVKRAEELAKKQQAILDEAKKREKDRQEKLSSKALTLGSKTPESKDHTWKPSTVATKAPGKEKRKHPFSSHILAEELSKKFQYPVEIKPYDETTDPKHHLDAFENRMLLLHEELHNPSETSENLPKPILGCIKTRGNPLELSGSFQHGIHTDRRALPGGQRAERAQVQQVVL